MGHESRTLRGGRGSTWGPLLIGLFGAGLIGGGILAPDPSAGFPPCTPAGATTISTGGLLHFVLAEIAFLGLCAACFAIAAGGGASWSLLLFWIGILLA